MEEVDNQPVTYFAGALARQDMKAVQRGLIAYGSIIDTQKKSLAYAGKMFTKASQKHVIEKTEE